MRFVLDESSLTLCGAPTAAELQRFEDLLELVTWVHDPARGLANGMNPAGQGRPVWRSREVFDAPVEPGRPLHDFLFVDPLPAWRDLIRRLIIQLDRMPEWEDLNVSSVLDVQIGGETYFAPTIGVAWTCLSRGHAVACLALAHQSRRTAVPVVVDGVERMVYFVVQPTDFREFFRALVEVENVGPQEFPEIAPAAFPDLEWADGVWQGLKTKKSSFFGGNRPILMEHLTTLNDRGAKIFHECPGGHGVDKRMSGIRVSSENGKARSYKPSSEARTVKHRDTSHVFWCHTKITYDDGRIHFLHFPARLPDPKRPTAPPDPAEGVIAIGIFNDHCVLPGH